MRYKVDINCDLGESFGEHRTGNDEEVMPHITSANVACGFHAGDPMTMARTIRLAKKFKVAVGAHPGLPDLIGFGRREMQLEPEEAKNCTTYQIGALLGFAKTTGIDVQHVKPHGALYNMAVKDERLAKAIAEAARTIDDNLILFAPQKSALAQAGTDAGIRVAYEFFADRAYDSSGNLVSRRQANAIIREPRSAVARAVKAVIQRTVLASDGTTLDIGEMHTICVHGDSPSAVKLVRLLKKGLMKAKVKVESVAKFV